MINSYWMLNDVIHTYIISIHMYKLHDFWFIQLFVNILMMFFLNKQNMKNIHIYIHGFITPTLFSHSKSFYWLGVTVAFNWKWVVMKSHGPQVLLFKVNKKLYLYVSIQSSASTCEKCRWKLNSLWRMFDFEQNCGKHRNSDELASFLEFLGGQTQHVHKKHKPCP